VEGGIKKDNSLLVKYFAEAFRSNWMGKKAGDYMVLQLNRAFDEKERDWIIGDLGLNKEDISTASKYFKVVITKVGLLEKKELAEEFFKQLYPGGEVTTEAEFRDKIKEQIQAYWTGQANNQIHDQVFHQLVDHTEIKFPEGFLKKWVKTQGDASAKAQGQKTDEEVEKEFPAFINQLKWTLISDKIVQDNGIQVTPDEIKSFAKQQLFSYMSGADLSDDQPWVTDYVEKMMKDRKFVDDAYTRIQTQKLFQWADTQVKPAEKDISAEEFTKMVEVHQQHHH
jgi:trigger factor